MSTVDELMDEVEHHSDIDIIGINSYGGGPSLAQRYKQAGGTKPYLVTEYGPPGIWEIGKNAWGAYPEPTSTASNAILVKRRRGENRPSPKMTPARRRTPGHRTT